MSVELEVLNSVIKNVAHRNEYVATINFMHGDADFYANEVVAYEDVETMKQLLQVLHNCSKLFRNGKSGWESYEDAVGYELFFEVWEKDIPDDFEPIDNLNWPSNEGCPASFSGVDVSYFDSNGVEHLVKVTYKKEQK